MASDQTSDMLAPLRSRFLRLLGRGVSSSLTAHQTHHPADSHRRRLGEYLVRDATQLHADDFLDIFGLCRRTQDAELTSQFVSRFITSEVKNRKTVTYALQSVQHSRLPGQTVFDLLAASEQVLDDQHYSIALAALKSIGDYGPKTLALCQRLTGSVTDQILASTVLSFYSELPEEIFDPNCDRILRDSLALLDRLTSRGVRLAEHLFGPMLVISGRCRASSLIQELSRRMEQEGYGTSLYSLTALMTALAYDKDFHRAIDVFERIVEAGLKVKAITLTKLLDICIQAKEHHLGLKILGNWIASESKVSWNVYRCALYLLNGVKADLKDESFNKVLSHLHRKVKECSRKTSIEEKIPPNMLGFSIYTLYKHDRINNPFDFIPFSLLPPKVADEVVMSCLNVIIERREWRLMLSVHERFRHHDEISPETKVLVLGYSVGLMLQNDAEYSPWPFLEQNLEYLRSDGRLRFFRYFNSLKRVGAEQHITATLLALKGNRLLDDDIVLDALSVCNTSDFAVLRTFLTVCASDEELKKMLLVSSTAVIERLKGRLDKGDDQAEELRRILRENIGLQNS